MTELPSEPKAMIDRWGAALGLGDDVEVERLVCQSRADRVDAATSGLLGTMLGGVVAGSYSRDDRHEADGVGLGIVDGSDLRLVARGDG